MSSVSTKIVFQAILKTDQFASQVVKLGGVFPEIEIELADSNSGLHLFKIAKLLPHFGQEMIASAVAEGEIQIDLFWNILAYIRDTSICPLGTILYEANGQVIEFNPPSRPSLVATLTGVAGNAWFDDKVEQFHKPFNLDLLKRFNFARGIQEPIGKFISLYSLLLSRCKDSQHSVDKLIVGVEPNIAQSLSPKSGKPETIFTRLRNELAHHRTGGSVVQTHREIQIHSSRFEWIVKVIAQRELNAV